MQDTPEIRARLRISGLRRNLSMMALCGLGAALVYSALLHDHLLAVRAVAMLAGAGALVAARAIRTRTSSEVQLTARGLQDEDGTRIAMLDNIARVDRGVFAFKPSNGFTIRLHRDLDAPAWRPGLWWRYGRRVGVGGMTPVHQSKLMAELLAQQVAQQDTGPDDHPA